MNVGLVYNTRSSTHIQKSIDLQGYQLAVASSLFNYYEPDHKRKLN